MRAAKQNGPLNYLLSLLLLLSGFAGISYEILYGRLLGNLIGDQFAVSASVLITFLLGTGLGSAYAHRWRNGLWLIELGIGVCAALFALIYDGLEQLLYTYHGLLSEGLGGKLLVCSILLSIPAFLVGCSVPLFSSYLEHADSQARFTRVYTVYNLGAALTALILEFMLIRYVGIKGALWCFAAVNAAISLCLRLWFIPGCADARQSIKLDTFFSRRLLAALAVASVASAAFQLFMLKLAEMMFGPFRETFALVLAIVLLGIAVGTALVRWFRIGFTALLGANLLGLTLLLLSVEPAIQFYAEWYERAAESHASLVAFKFGLLLSLMAIPAATFGATIPALLQRNGDVAKDSGRLLFVSAWANGAGFLLMVFVLHQYLEYGMQLLAIAAISLLAWVISSDLRTSRWAYAVLAALGLIGLHRKAWDEDLLYLSYTSFHSTQDLREARHSFKSMHTFKGYQDVFAITWYNKTPHFFINGYVSFPLNSASERVVGLLASYFSPRTDQALVLGLGSGSTASVVGLAFDNTDAVEINPAVRANLYQMKEWNFDIEHNTRVNIIVDDAIHYARTSGKTYSLILNTVTSPLYFSSSKLYTEDFFRIVKKRLRPDGIYATWVDSRIGDKGFDIILKTLNTSFKECGIFYIKTTYFLLLCGDQPLALQQTELSNKAPELWRELLEKFYISPDYLPYNLLTTQALKLVKNTDVAVNRLDFPALEFEMAGLTHKGIPAFKTTLAGQMSITELAGVLAPVAMGWNPLNLEIHADRLLDDSYITKRWHDLLRAAIPEYVQAYNAAELQYFARLAETADTAKSHHKYGFQLMKRDRHQEALQQFSLVLAQNPRYNNTYFNMAACYERLGDLEKAADYFQRELIVDPGDEDVPPRLGKIFVQLGQYEKGLFYLNAITKPADAHSKIYKEKALAALRKS